MNKILSLLVCLTAMVNGSAGFLRAWSPIEVESASSTAVKDTIHEFGGATLYINHVAASGGWDDQAVATAFIDAYNKVHAGGDRIIVSAFIDNTIELPEDGTAVVLGRSQKAGLRQDWTHYNSISWCKFQYGEPQESKLV